MRIGRCRQGEERVRINITMRGRRGEAKAARAVETAALALAIIASSGTATPLRRATHESRKVAASGGKGAM
jgi:hypothetical protein